MDARLNRFRHIREGIDELLKDLKKVTTDIKTALSEDPAEGSGEIEPPETLKDKTDNTVVVWESDEGETELQQLHGEIRNIIPLLNQMANMIPRQNWYGGSIQNAR